MTRPCSRRLFVPLVVLASLGWVALIVAGGGLQAEQFIDADALPQSMGCGLPGPAPVSPLRAKSEPCAGLVPLNPPARRRTTHEHDHPDLPSP
ncbi:MAG: hypothetical protein ABI887_10945 [Burkholderiales bacterium]